MKDWRFPVTVNNMTWFYFTKSGKTVEFYVRGGTRINRFSARVSRLRQLLNLGRRKAQ